MQRCTDEYLMERRKARDKKMKDILDRIKKTDDWKEALEIAFPTPHCHLPR